MFAVLGTGRSAISCMRLVCATSPADLTFGLDRLTFLGYDDPVFSLKFSGYGCHSTVTIFVRMVRYRGHWGALLRMSLRPCRFCLQFLQFFKRAERLEVTSLQATMYRVFCAVLNPATLHVLKLLRSSQSFLSVFAVSLSCIFGAGLRIRAVVWIGFLQPENEDESITSCGFLYCDWGRYPYLTKFEVCIRRWRS